MTDWHTERDAGSRLAGPAVVTLPRFPDWVTETYQALDHIEHLRSAQQPTHQTALDTTETDPNTSQIKSPKPTERKCRR
ncbi:hypothetical protein ACFV27_37215 [Streptomyces antimycoticus]|uniref:hypothetical protein n=1 Tax=Streptomyces antimycoticus TaxID=68175 RepID=UPI0036B5ACC3